MMFEQEKMNSPHESSLTNHVTSKVIEDHDIEELNVETWFSGRERLGVARQDVTMQSDMMI